MQREYAKRFADDMRRSMAARGMNATALAILLGETSAFAHMAAARTWISKALKANMKAPQAVPFLRVCYTLGLNPSDYGLPMFNAETIPVAGCVKDHLVIMYAGRSAQGHHRVICRPADVPSPHAVAIEVIGSDTPPLIPGLVLIFDPTRPPQIGEYATVTLADGTTHVRRWDGKQSKKGAIVAPLVWLRSCIP